MSFINDTSSLLVVHSTLARALDELRDRGGQPPCATHAHPDWWFSDRAAERAEAVRICHGCPIRGPCAEAGADEQYGIWGGQDKKTKPKARGSLNHRLDQCRDLRERYCPAVPPA
jgi:hypothetical protein